ncbi:polysaccharide lyase [Spirosoma rhododendri]|uniref:Polysaccharide lyase n=1 Tax=Spirosoma rhododendri TaxID=2728024 RepID=A0A7L5DKJ0_9BACT|nr:polysaccharide lyase [Spirosoma rhododendri]QJD77693.1 hypothetical protein HH216_04115 [Spirosoma rhododendri]
MLLNTATAPLLNTLRTLLLLVVVSAGLMSCSQSENVAPQSQITTADASARPGSSVINNDGFEGSWFSNFWIPELRTATAGTISTDHSRSGKQSMRFSWTPAQYDGTNPSAHSELGTDALKNGEVERWYGYSVYMPAAKMANDNEPIVFSQWHGVANPGEEDTFPPLAFYLEGGNQIKAYYRSSNVAITKAQQMPTAQTILRLGTATYDKWVDYVVHIKWDPSGNTGILEIWQDGKQVANERNINIGYPQKYKPYWKAGIYAWTGKSKYAERVLYYDDVTIGKATATYETVKPGQTNDIAR